MCDRSESPDRRPESSSGYEIAGESLGARNCARRVQQQSADGKQRMNVGKDQRRSWLQEKVTGSERSEREDSSTTVLMFAIKRTQNPIRRAREE
jgi:hypothetical protein